MIINGQYNSANYFFFLEVGNGHEGLCDSGLMGGDNYFPFSSSLG